MLFFGSFRIGMPSFCMYYNSISQNIPNGGKR